MRNNTLFPALSFFVFLFNLAKPINAFADTVHFNPDDPIYIEYHPKEKQTDTDISLQIEDKKSSAKIRLSLQAKPEAPSVFYGYMWLRIGKNISNEVVFKKVSNEVQFKRASNEVVYKKTNTQELYSWVTEQDNVQALFLFDDAKELASFKATAENSIKPLTDTKSLPELAKPASVSKETVKNQDTAKSEMGETLKYANLMEAYGRLSPKQKILNDKKADLFAKAALEYYQKGEYPAAEKHFAQSLRLNPMSAINKYYLALCFYQSEKYERSLALLSLAEGADYNYAEYKYYAGLNNLKLKNYPKALEDLGDARDENDADYSGPAAFFMGHIYFQKEDHTLAKQNFEITVDQSKNPKMDREAEAMIEKIDQIELFKAQMKQRFLYNLTLGFGYDSNILNVSTDNQTTNLNAYRVLYGANLGYKLFHDMTHDMVIDFSANDYYSLDSTFKANSTIQASDPLILTLGLPYHRRIESGKRVYSWGFTPSYQILSMSLDGGARKKILDTTLFATDLSFAVTPQFYSRYALEYGVDNSSIPVPESSPESDLSAKKISISTTQTYIADPAMKRSWALDVGYNGGDANGDNNDYTKYLAALTYSQMALWSTVNSFRLDYAGTKYTKNPNDRSDTVNSLTYSLNKEVFSKVNLGLSAQYTMSTSSIETYKYNKFNIQGVFSYGGGF
jgi:tetratricopeptide (TPR) repeat protein